MHLYDAPAVFQSVLSHSIFIIEQETNDTSVAKESLRQLKTLLVIEHFFRSTIGYTLIIAHFLFYEKSADRFPYIITWKGLSTCFMLVLCLFTVGLYSSVSLFT